MTPPPKPEWAVRNVKWLVPAGIIFTAACIGVFIAFIFGMLKNSEPYRLAMERVRASPAVVAALGTPIEEGFFIRGNLHVSTTAGQAQFEIPLHGPKGNATAELAANRAAGTWHFEYLTVKMPDSDETIDLLDETKTSRPEEKRKPTSP